MAEKQYGTVDQVQEYIECCVVGVVEPNAAVVI